MDENREKAYAFIRRGIGILSFAIVAVFFVHPLAELLHRLIADTLNEGFYFPPENDDNYLFRITNGQESYRKLIRAFREFTTLASKLIIGLIAVYVIISVKELRAGVKKYLKPLLPFVIFGCFSGYIYLSSVVRGMPNYDMTGDMYQFESIFDYMSYPFVYFLAGVLISRSSQQRVILYIFTFSSVPVALLTICNTYFLPIRYLTGDFVSGIFHNSNHYGYYLVLVMVASALLYVYEKNKALKISILVSFIISNATVIFVDTLGVQLAIFCAIVLFVVYTRKAQRENYRAALRIFVIFIIVSAVCSLISSDLFKSIIQTFIDIGNIAKNNKEAAHAGRSRWRVWKETVRCIGEKPLFGWGTIEISRMLDIYPPHNDFLMYSSNYGIPAGIFYACGLGVIFWRSWKWLGRAKDFTKICFFAAGGFFLSSMLGNSMFYTTPLFWCFLGLMYSGYMRDNMPLWKR